MAPQPEAAIVRQILATLNALPNTYARKTHGSRYSAQWPDIVGCHRGTMFALEVKTKAGRSTPRQDHELAKWRAAGARAEVVRSVDEALAAIEHEPVLTREQVRRLTVIG